MSQKNKSKPQEISFVPYERPIELGKWEAFSTAIWNSEEGTVLGRTGKSWAKILSFYVVFYSCLAGMYAICMQGLFYYVSDAVPYFQLDHSLIGSNPGLGFRPISENPDVEGSLVWYTAANKTESSKWSTKLDKFLEDYQVSKGLGKNQQVCGYDKPPSKGKVCTVDVQSWAPCNSEHGYSFNQSSPCIFLKLNRIFGWEPEFYTDLQDLPADMPQDMKDLIRSSPNNTLDTVWLSCTGENPYDKENIGPIKYFPQQGFPGYYFPYLNIDGYLSPLVAVHFERPKVNVLINIECRAWSKNIFYSNRKGIREGSVHFELLID